jgi:hypothetical protein
MIRVEGGLSYLVLARQPDRTTHEVHVFTSFAEALAAWSGGARMSPIFATTPHPFPSDDDLWLTFAGPVHPGDVDTSSTVPIFLTFGLFNVLFVSRTDTELEAVRDLLKQRLHIPFEEWEIRNHVLVDPIRSAHMLSSRSSKSAVRGLGFTHAAVAESAREYALLMSTAIGRALDTAPSLERDLRQFDRTFRKALAGHDTTQTRPTRVTPESRSRNDSRVVQQGMLVRTNAALSRFTSQTFAGISPITETECHFWTHSLLGIGSASLALVHLRSFIDNILGPKLRLIERLELLDDIALTPELAHLRDSDQFFDTDYLLGHSPPCPVEVKCIYSAQERFPPASAAEARDYLPVISCFSGRDGFRSTDVSLSAPLETLTSSNAVAWTLRTITHEISHTYIADALAVLAPVDAEQMQRLHGLFTGELRCQSLLDSVRKYLAIGFWWSVHPEHQSDPPPDEFRAAVVSFWVEAQEIMTDTFDFLYFYRGDPEAYARSAWVSWGVVPNIAHRMEEYVTRTLCALAAVNLRARKSLGATVEQLRDILARLHKDFPDALYIKPALDDLSSRVGHYRKRLDDRSPLVKITRQFLYSSVIEQALLAEPGARGSRTGEGYPEHQLRFSESRVANPLRFLGAFSNDKQPNAARSFWLVQQLAHGE